MNEDYSDLALYFSVFAGCAFLLILAWEYVK